MESSGTNLSRNSAEAHTPRQSPKTVIFLLNRNGLEEDKLRSVFEAMLVDKYVAENVKTYWVSIFGQLPERPHAFITLTDDNIAEEILNDDKIAFDHGGKSYLFEISKAIPQEAGPMEDENCIFVQGVPVTGNPDILETQLKEFFGGIATPNEIIFPQRWAQTGQVILRFDDVPCAQMLARTALYCFFQGKLLKCCYARKRVSIPPPQVQVPVQTISKPNPRRTPPPPSTVPAEKKGKGRKDRRVPRK
jgi:hypothetical protein